MRKAVEREPSGPCRGVADAHRERFRRQLRDRPCAFCFFLFVILCASDLTFKVHAGRAPVQPMGCKLEREAALECYRKSRGMPAGEVVFACQRAVRDLDKCAILMREASLAQMSPASLVSS